MEWGYMPTEVPWSLSRWLVGSIGLIPLLYSLGFIAWASYFGWTELGFHALPAPQYLLVGLLFATFFGPMFGLEIWYHRNGWQQRALVFNWKGLKFQALLSLGRWLAFCLVFALLGNLYGALGILTLNNLQLLVVGLAIGGLMAVLATFMTLVGILLLPLKAGLNWLIERFVSDEATIEVPEETVRWMGQFARAMAPATFISFWLLIGSFTFGGLLLDQVTHEFGGAEPRQAELAIVPNALPLTMRSAVFAANQTGNETVWTQPVFVLYSDDDSLLIRVSQPAVGPLYEVPKAVVTAIHWHA